MTPGEPPADMKARTPAPEGEACPHDAYEADAAGQPVRCVDCGMAIASAAAPVVPVGVSREEIAKALFDRHWSAVSASPKWPGDDDGSYWLWLADAIIAALRPTDTGWRDIATAPRNGDDVLACDDETGERHVSYWTGHYWSGRTGFKPTHWMPLHPAPTDTGWEA